MEALKTNRMIRLAVSLVLAATGTAGCSQGSGAFPLRDDAALSVVHPRDAAEKIAQYATEINKIIGLGRKLDRTTVLPLPCGSEGSRRTILGKNVDLQSWWVSYSPYSESLDTFVELESPRFIQQILARLHNGLREAGWQIIEYTEAGSSEGAVLKAAAPEAGYGATFEGIAPTAERTPRIGVNISSPCLRHPEAR